MGLRRVWEFISKVGKKRNEREVSSDPGFWEFQKRGLLLDHVHPSDITGWGWQSMERAEGARPEGWQKKTKRPPTCQR